MSIKSVSFYSADLGSGHKAAFPPGVLHFLNIWSSAFWNQDARNVSSLSYSLYSHCWAHLLACIKWISQMYKHLTSEILNLGFSCFPSSEKCQFIFLPLNAKTVSPRCIWTMCIIGSWKTASLFLSGFSHFLFFCMMNLVLGSESSENRAVTWSFSTL